MSLDYFRRPLLAGKNLPRLPSATIRGSLRRSNPANGILVPHFPNVAADMTFKVKFEDGVERTTTLTGNGFQQILDEINAGISTYGRAFDADGCIAIQTLVPGGLGSVEVTGGTAAALIGFDTKGGVPLRSVGGDLASVSEGRNGTAFGAVLPPKNENLSSDSYRIAMGRIAGNVDLIYADLARRQTKVSKVGIITLNDQTSNFAGSAAYGLLSVPQGTQVYSGYGHLSRLSTKEDLAPYFLLVDKKTGQPAASRVVAVVKGTVVGTTTINTLDPFANATTSDGNGNVLGVLNPRFAPAAGITSIKNGRVIQSAAGTFAKVKAGDWVKIEGQDETINKNPWDNRGLRWVVEDVIGGDGDAIAVRPMSASELSLAGTTVKDEQPILELNDQKTGNQVFGTVTVYAGTYIDDPKLVVSPPISDDVELWAGIPMSYRDQSSKEDAWASAVFARMLMGDQSDLPDSLITVPTLTMSGTSGQDDRTITVGECYIRWKGRVVRIGGGSVVVGAQRANEVWIYIDKASLLPTLSAGGGAVLAFGNIPVAYFPPGNQASPNYIGRVLETRTHPVTVGIGGQFATLTDAIEWFHQASAAAQPYYEFLITTSQTAPAGGWVVKKSGLHIRGTSRAILLDRAPGDVGNLFTLDQSVVTSFNLSNVTVGVTDPTKVWGVTGVGATPSVFFTQIMQSGGATMVAMHHNGSFELTTGATKAYLRGLGGRTLDLGDNTAVDIGHTTDANVYTTVRSKLKAVRVAELVAGVLVGDAATGTGNASFYGDVNIGQVGRLKTLLITGHLTVTGNVSLGSTGTTLETLAKLVMKLGADVGTSASPQDLTVYGNLVVGQNANRKSVTIYGTTDVYGTATFRDDIDAATNSPVGKGVVKSRALQVAGATGTNVDATGKLTVGGAGKGYMATDGEIGNANAKIDATGKLTAKTAEVAGANGTSIDGSGNVQVGGANKVRLGIDGSVKGNTFVAQDAAGATQASVSGTDGSASFKKKVTLDPSTAAANDKVFEITGVASVDKEGDANFASLSIDGKLLLDMPAPNASKGAFHIIAAAIRHGRRLYVDEEFALGTNGHGAYGGSFSVTRQASASAPNKSGYVLKVSSSSGTPVNGGFVVSTPANPPRLNATYVQTFRALVPAGVTLVATATGMGTGGDKYWLTNNVGTGKWEDYAIVWVFGDSNLPVGNTFGYVTGTFTPPTLDMYLAASTIFDVTDLGMLAGANEVSVPAGAAGTPTVNKTNVQDQLAALSLVMPTGSIIQYAGVGLPTGWLACNGQAVSRAAYPDLFAALMTTWGAGDGSTTFNVPDLRSRSPIGAYVAGAPLGTDSRGAPLAQRPIGSVGGEQEHVLTEAELAKHKHTWQYGVERDDANSGGSYNEFTQIPGSHTTAIGATGGDAPHNNMSPYAAVFFIIKY